MPHMRDFLSRFRPAGAPGAGRAVVPADRRRERESELSPVLMLLDGQSADCSAIVAAAEHEAAQILREARAQADSISAAARERAAASVDELVRAAVDAARTRAAELRETGAADAVAITRRARRRLPSLADRAVGLVRDLGDGGPP